MASSEIRPRVSDSGVRFPWSSCEIAYRTYIPHSVFLRWWRARIVIKRRGYSIASACA